MAAAIMRATRVPDIRKGDQVSSSPARTPASRARSNGSSVACRRRPVARASTGASSAAGGVKVVVEGLNIAKRHTKPRQSRARATGCRRSSRAASSSSRSPSRSGKRDARLLQLRQADPHRARHPRDGRRVRVCRHCGEQQEVEVVTSQLHERYRGEVVPALQKQFEYANPNQVPRVSKIVVNIGLGEALTNAKSLDAALGDLTDDHRPEADRDQGQALDRPVPPADGQLDRCQGDPARRAHVGLPGARDEAGAAAHPRLPGRPGPVVRWPGQLHASGCASNSRSPRSITTRSTVCAGWR